MAAEHLERTPRHLAREAAVVVQRGEIHRHDLAVDLRVQVRHVELGGKRAVPAEADADAVRDQRRVGLADAEWLAPAGAEAQLGARGG